MQFLYNKPLPLPRHRYFQDSLFKIADHVWNIGMPAASQSLVVMFEVKTQDYDACSANGNELKPLVIG
jgi:hypothetical protein